MCRKGHVFVQVFLSLLAMEAGLVAADDDASAAVGDYQQLLMQLDAEEYAAREAASRALLGDATLTRQRWEGLLDAALTPEQVHRLVAVGVHVTVREQIEPFIADQHPGALGMHHAGMPAAALESTMRQAGVEPRSGAGVCVIRTEPGFPAHVVLRAGDLIVGIDGQPLAAGVDVQAASDDLVRRIRDAGCGRQVVLTLWRAGRRMEVEVQLSSLPVLQQTITRNLAAEVEAAILRELASPAPPTPAVP